MEVATYIFFHIVVYIQVKQIIKKKKVSYYFPPRIEENLNVSLQSIVRQGWVLSGLHYWRCPADMIREETELWHFV